VDLSTWVRWQAEEYEQRSVLRQLRMSYRWLPPAGRCLGTWEIALRNEHVRVGDRWLDDPAKRRRPQETEDGDDAIGEDRSQAE
jgi:hypothetical protein